jgi:hypothetical protein
MPGVSGIIYVVIMLGQTICLGLVIVNTTDDTCRTFIDQL